MKKKNKDDRALFAHALSEAFERKYKTDLAQSSETLYYCKRCERNVRREISGYYYRRRRPAVMAAAVLIAVFVTCSCSWSAHRVRMGDYLIEYTAEAVRVFTTHKVKYDLSEYKSYQLGYVPDGYVLTYESEKNGSTRYMWENSEGDVIDFNQTVYSQLGDFDNKGDEKYFIDHNGTEVLYIEGSDRFNAYIYCSGMYHMVIKSNERLSDEVIGQMIDSITEK